MFAHTRAATVAPASTDALPVSVRRKDRSAVLPPHRVRPENPDSGAGSLTRSPPRRSFYSERSMVLFPVTLTARVGSNRTMALMFLNGDGMHGGRAHYTIEGVPLIGERRTAPLR